MNGGTCLVDKCTVDIACSGEQQHVDEACH